MIKPTSIGQFIRLAQGPYLGYNDAGKAKFHRQARKLATMVAERLGLTDYDIRFNAGGIAVCGETTLHAENIYIQFSQSVSGLGFMYRSCKGRTDYTGGPNQWMQWAQLADLDQACQTFAKVMTK